MESINTENQKPNMASYIIVPSLVMALIAGGGVFFWQHSVLKNVQDTYDRELNKLRDTISQIQNDATERQLDIVREYEQDDSEIEMEKDEEDSNVLSSHFPKELQQKEVLELLTPSEGFFIVTSLVSHDKNKIVYTEVSEGVKDIVSAVAPWEYNIFVRDLTNGKTSKIYSGPQKRENSTSTLCPIAFFPRAWSQHDKKIVLEWGNPTDCGSGGAPVYQTFVIDPSGGDILGLATYDSFVFDDYAKIAYVDASGKTPNYCGPGMQENYGAIILVDVETGVRNTIMEEPNSHYRLQDVGEDGNLTYTVRKVMEVDGCGKYDDSVTEETKTITM
ncbi:MAG: hypothetical protein COV60_01475 [Candidatus Magasanikbacteria bacterium CG11_big_fil_rev_8_21_14_0_20_43_7]|uniref:Uncharacterized protein n=1 Tax=Candidatus Magasanikbacteria bacterium CG11_big_fil_rev_8_21_14_0_20_43_7 TaxID=1974654 RepID=A0A2H0N2V8_9BACT|nr:MAG: hypothetical protein COV60_01475 [Candidatus Magasanikbacteria bacterium CG11_big_fil_rev_8_21_14_0_20_43_7]